MIYVIVEVVKNIKNAASPKKKVFQMEQKYHRCILHKDLQPPAKKKII